MYIQYVYKRMGTQLIQILASMHWIPSLFGFSAGEILLLRWIFQTNSKGFDDVEIILTQTYGAFCVGSGILSLLYSSALLNNNKRSVLLTRVLVSFSLSLTVDQVLRFFPAEKKRKPLRRRLKVHWETNWQFIKWKHYEHISRHESSGISHSDNHSTA